ncbi:MAG: cell division protein ZapD [Gammaproteobacteria bacterium]|nr:cell division protein ZapD [Gammaproteobacteria bacterium]
MESVPELCRRARLEQNTAMNANEAVVPSADAATRVIVYEQPLNERMRNFLRLDFLYQQAVHHHTKADPWSTRAAVSALLEILAITQRGDIRSEVLKELERQMSQLSSYNSRPGVDASRLRVLLTKLHRMREELSNVGALFMQKLRDSEFLNAIKHRSTIPGGTCEFDLPDYTHWLNLPDEVRGADFAHWLAIIRPLGDAVGELLWMTREQARSKPEVAPGGVFHLALDRDVPAQMIRIALPAGTDIYPEISGSHYRCSIRFLVWQDAGNRPVQTTEDVRFTLSTCT